jgi:hypothetical protein
MDDDDEGTLVRSLEEPLAGVFEEDGQGGPKTFGQAVRLISWVIHEKQRTDLDRLRDDGLADDDRQDANPGEYGDEELDEDDDGDDDDDDGDDDDGGPARARRGRPSLPSRGNAGDAVDGKEKAVDGEDEEEEEKEEEEEEDDGVADPLGLVDSRMLKYSMPLYQRQLDEMPPAAEGGRRSLDVASAAFHPLAFLALVHRQTPYAQLLESIDLQRAGLEQQRAELEVLVRANFARFIRCKDTIDYIAGRMGQMQQRGEGVDTLRMVYEGLADRANDLFGEMVARRRESVRLRKALRVLQRFSFVLEIPSRIQEARSKDDLEAVVHFYRISCQFRFDPRIRIFSYTRQQTNAMIALIRGEIAARLRLPTTPLDRQIDLVRVLQKLNDVAAAPSAADAPGSSAPALDLAADPTADPVEFALSCHRGWIEHMCDTYLSDRFLPGQPRMQRALTVAIRLNQVGSVMLPPMFVVAGCSADPAARASVAAYAARHIARCQGDVLARIDEIAVAAAAEVRAATSASLPGGGRSDRDDADAEVATRVTGGVRYRSLRFVGVLKEWFGATGLACTQMCSAMADVPAVVERVREYQRAATQRYVDVQFALAAQYAASVHTADEGAWNEVTATGPSAPSVASMLSVLLDDAMGSVDCRTEPTISARLRAGVARVVDAYAGSIKFYALQSAAAPATGALPQTTRLLRAYRNCAFLMRDVLPTLYARLALAAAAACTDDLARAQAIVQKLVQLVMTKYGQLRVRDARAVLEHGLRSNALAWRPRASAVTEVSAFILNYISLLGRTLYELRQYEVRSPSAILVFLLGSSLDVLPAALHETPAGLVELMSPQLFVDVSFLRGVVERLLTVGTKRQLNEVLARLGPPPNVEKLLSEAFARFELLSDALKEAERD